ncbi:acyltransferase [Rhodocaloribacter litoris]|uniref:DapH/DapD/GlmU-related protein n=1 Tax=Rhodocaloribacter litoris TaxID=2558931 RepID=UPI00141EF5F8|nr:DapH/DapD/GlmU-related protein [Rhodocaloribacter litoris]QXD16203.1 acyltransferase [Rhodocaloribacter litoris]
MAMLKLLPFRKRRSNRGLRNGEGRPVRKRGIVRRDTKVRKLLDETGRSRADRYRMLVVGQPGWGALIKYELVMLLSSWVPGVLGLFLRSRLYPLVLGHVGKGVVFGTGVVLRHPHKIVIGDNVVIDDNCLLDAKGATNQGISIGNGVFVGRNTILSCKDGDIRLEDRVNIGFNCEIFSSSRVTVGEGTLLAAYCYLVGGGNYDIAAGAPAFADQEGLESRGIDIGAHCWLGAGVKVMDGVTIGEGAVIGAGAVVRSAIPPRSLAAGVPCRVIRSRKAGGVEKTE